MFTVQLTNRRFGYTSHYGSFASLALAQAAARLVRQHSGLDASFKAVPTPDGITPRPLHFDLLMRRP